MTKPEQDLFGFEPAPRYPETPGFVNGSETSEDAARRYEPVAGTERARVLNYVAGCGAHGATCDEVEEAIGLKHQTASARLRELFLGGRVRRVGTRLTRSNRKADVHIAV